MDTYHTDEIVRGLIKRRIIKKKDEQKAITAIAEQWEDREIIVWGVADIIDRAKQHKIKLTENEARDILQNMMRHHDCTIGITWDTIDAYLPAKKR